MGSAIELREIEDVFTSQTHKLILGKQMENATLKLNGNDLSIKDLHAVIRGRVTEIEITEDAKEAVQKSFKVLQDHLNKHDTSIYGVNTGFGGSADVRHGSDAAVQRGLVTHLNAGFGDTLPSWLVKATMVIRVNSLSRGYSAVCPQVLERLKDLINHDIIPCVPKRGSVSASGDLMPTSYIAACLEGRPDLKVFYKGKPMKAPEALKKAGLEPVVFVGKDALAVLNAASVAAAMGAELLCSAAPCIMLTQTVVALAVEALQGRLESFHPVVQDKCMPHPGQIEVARNIRCMLEGTRMGLTQLEVSRGEMEGILRQDRYPLRTSPQWLAPVLETVSRLQQCLHVELNSANDNPIIDPATGLVLHCGNFQGTSITVAMDQLRQSLQICGKLLFALMSEVMDIAINNGLTPNLCGSDPRVDMGFKGTETAMASYQSELDYLTHPMTPHVLSAELRNQAVNSLALVSARSTEAALEILQMELANILCALMQALELRCVRNKVEVAVRKCLQDSGITENGLVLELLPWYEFLYLPQETIAKMVAKLPSVKSLNVGALSDLLCPAMTKIYSELTNGHLTEEVAASMGQGTKKAYLFIRETLGIQFHDGKRPLDTSLQTIYDSIQDERINSVISGICQLCL